MKYTPGTDLDAVRKQFLSDVAGHSLTVLHDDGYYRHLDLRRDDGSSEFWFEILTSPGTLTIRGDKGSFVFVRLEDMFAFFGDSLDRVNPPYWAEKVVAEDTSAGIADYSEEVVRDLVRTRFNEITSEADAYSADEGAELWKRIEIAIFGYLDTEETARSALRNFMLDGKPPFVVDAEESDLRAYTERFLWALCAIPWAIRLYRGVKEGSVTLMVRPEQLEAFAECRSPVVDPADPEQTATPCGACSSCDLAAAISARKKFLAAAEGEEESPI